MKLAIVRFRTFLLATGDMVCLAGGLFLALVIRYGWPIPEKILSDHRLPFTILFCLWFLTFYVGGLYNLRQTKNQRQFFALFFTLLGINAALSVLVFYFIPFFSVTPKTVLFLDLGVTAGLLLIWRSLMNAFFALPPLKFVLLGSGDEVHELLGDVHKHPELGYECAAHYTTPQEVLNLVDFVKKQNIDAVVVALDYRTDLELQKKLFACIPLQIQFYDFVEFYEQYFQRIPLAAIDRAWFLENFNEPEKRFFSTVKRGTDILLGILLGIPGLVFFPFIALAVWLSMGRPVFFIQQRVSRYEKPFWIYKFRTMKQERHEATITRVGQFLRRTHLDEIPQLWNILLGEMSFIGPRPEQVQFVNELKAKIPFYSERSLVAPGVTGWAQLHEPRARAEDALAKLQYDLFYVKHRSLLFDLEIVLRTLRVLIL